MVLDTMSAGQGHRPWHTGPTLHCKEMTGAAVQNTLLLWQWSHLDLRDVAVFVTTRTLGGHIWEEDNPEAVGDGC